MRFSIGQQCVRYLKVDHGQDLFAPLNEERSAHVQVEVGEAFSLRLRNQSHFT